ncbi:MAG: glycosyltransferase [Pseudomonadota bacterium]
MRFLNVLLSGRSARRSEARPGGEATGVSVSGKRLSVGWFVATGEITSASVRYRCHHMARALSHKGHVCRTFTVPAEIGKVLPTLDAIVIVKRLDGAVVDVVAAADAAGVPVFLDLCDDLLSKRYGKSREGRNRLNFCAIASSLFGITVPTSAMAQKVVATSAELGVTPPAIHIIPDIAETRDICDLTARFANTRPLPAPVATPPKTCKRILWFGNYGAKHSTFGIFSLLPTIPVLAALNRTIPLELVIVSNNEPLFEGLTRDSGVPARYVPWSPSAVYDELAAADVALLTTGDDEFSSIKSLNRTLQALAAGVPVVTTSAVPPEFEEIVLGGARNVRKNLIRVLKADRAAVRRELLAPSAPILRRYLPERIGALWEKLLLAAADRPRAGARTGGSPGVLFLLQTGDELEAMRGPIEEAARREVRSEILVRASALQNNPAIRDLLLAAGLLPRIFQKADELHPGALEGIDALVIADNEAAAARRLVDFARQLGCSVLDARGLEEGWLPVAQPSASAQAIAPGQPGPFPERFETDGSSDWAFIVHPNNRGWILEGICREIGSRQPGSWQVAYETDRLPKARSYFFSHFSLFMGFRRTCPERLDEANTFVWYTHPRAETAARVAQQSEEFPNATRIIFTCEAIRQLWIGRGLDPSRTAVVLGGADPALFRGHVRGGGAIGLSSSFYERKNPDLVRELVGLLPHRRFVLVGRGWRDYALFEDMLLAPNFTYLTVPYTEYPALYAGFDVFLSPSRLEGGPIPLLEAMMENAVPVASRTGFAPDLIRHGENGFLFDADAPAVQVADLIEKAFALSADVRTTVLRYDWDSFSRAIIALAR